VNRPDLRLAGFAVATWLAALAALYLPARCGLLIGAAGFAAAGIVAAGARIASVAMTTTRPAVPGRLVPAGRWLAVTVLLGAGCGAAATAVRVAVRDAGPLRTLVDAGATVRADLVVRDDPRTVGVVAGRPPTYLVAGAGFGPGLAPAAARPAGHRDRPPARPARR
jgi:competence protein ComEC